MDDQLQQWDSKTNWQQTYGSNFSRFGTNMPSKRNKTIGAPYVESGATFQYPYGPTSPFFSSTSPFQPAMGTGTSATFPKYETTCYYEPMSRPPVGMSSGAPYIESRATFQYPYGPTSPFFSSTSPFQPAMGTGTGATFPKYETTCYNEPMSRPPMGMSSGAPYIESRATFQYPYGPTSPFQPTMGTCPGATFPNYGTTCYYEPMSQPPMGMSSGAPYIESRATFQSAPFPCIRIVKDLTSGKNAKDKNLVFSPCSIQLALSLLANGAKGSTLDEFLKFVEAENRKHLNSIASELVDKLRGSSTEGGQALSLVGGVWVDNSLSLNPTFVTVAKNIYHGKAEVVEFRNEVKAKEALFEVNKWAEEATQGLIKSVLPEGSFNPGTRIVLGNALYFKGKWKKEFVKSLTKEAKFYLLNGKSIKVPFMTNRAKQFVRTFENFKVLRLPYKKSIDENAASLSMYIILPDEIDGLLPLTEMVCSDPLFFKKYIHDPYPSRVRVGSFWVPKFKITHDFEASKVLHHTGLKLPFTDQAEFDDLLLNPGPPLKVSKVFHKSYIEVDEEGTEAAAVTIVSFACGSCAPLPPPVNFVADHPFMFVVRDDTSGMVLFMGHVVNPLL